MTPAERDSSAVSDAKTWPDEARPVPGPRAERKLWTGAAEVWLSDLDADARPSQDLTADTLGHAQRRRRPRAAGGRDPAPGRIVGIDVARSIALIGMIAVHTLPPWNPSAGRATIEWILFAGNASALFAVIAGASLAFSSGGASPYRGRDLNRVLVQLGCRAVLLAVIGMALDLLNLPVYNILVYFAAMFILAIPLVRLSARTLIRLGIVLICVMPIIRYLIHRHISGAGYYPNPVFSDAVGDPLGLVSTLTITGIYPAATWIGLICLGIGVGRLMLTRSSTRLTLTVAGVLLVGFVVTVSRLIVYRFNGYSLIRASMPGATADSVDDFMVFGPHGQLPIGRPGWLLTSGPQTNTPLALLLGAGFSLAVIGIFLAVTGRWPTLLKPLIMAGTMPTTLYIGHLLFLKFSPNGMPYLLFGIQIAAALLFAWLWRMFMRQGPVEALISYVIRIAGRLIVPVRSQIKTK